MNSTEFIHWLRGFTEGCHEYSPTPKQWDLLKERLAEVCDDEEFEETPGMFEVHRDYPYPGTPIGPYGTGTPNHDLVQRYPWGGPVVWGTTTSGYMSASSISGSGTSTATNLPLGTTVTYTTSGGPTWYTINKTENDSTDK
jgi:hypothetical protein